MEVRKIQHDDYDNILVKWWNDWAWDAPTRDFLPDNGEGGIIIYDEDIPVCAGFVYVTNSKVAWVDWVISNKEYKKKPQRSEAIKLLVLTLTEISINLGNKYCYALIKHKSLIEVYQELGYIKSDDYVGEMIKII